MKNAFLTCGILLLAAGLAVAQTSAPPVERTLTTPAQTATAQNLSGAPLSSLDNLIAEALQKNPGVQAAQRQYEALRHRIPQAKSLPDPTVSVGWAGNIAPFSVQDGDPSSNRSVIAAQMLPYPGKLKLRGEVAGREAEAARWDYENARRTVVANVKAAFYDYFFYAKALDTTRKNKDLLQKLAQISEARYRVGKSVQQDVLKAQVEISRIDQRLTILQQQYDTAQARLNTLLFREPEAPLPAATTALEMPKLQYSLDQLYHLAQQNDTGLQREQRMIERNQLAVNLARKDYYPDFTVAYMYQQRPLMPDMHGLTVTANIPIFYKTKQREAVREASENLIGSERSKDNRQTELYFAVKEQYLQAKAAENLSQLYAQGVVPQSSLALESSMSAYQVGNVDFLTILTNFNTVLDYEVEYYRELADYNTALARLEPLVGVELTK